MSASILIASASLADAAPIAAIYAHHVLHGTATFETVPPGVDEIAARMAKVLDAGWPWLVAREDQGGGQGVDVVGYAYAAQYNPRAGYRYACEDSIYLRHDRQGRGLGTRLLAALLEASQAWGFRQMIAGIAGSEPASLALHARAGFAQVARLASVGRKHGQWLDVIYMQRALGDGAAAPPPQEP